MTLRTMPTTRTMKTVGDARAGLRSTLEQAELAGQGLRAALERGAFAPETAERARAWLAVSDGTRARAAKLLLDLDEPDVPHGPRARRSSRADRVCEGDASPRERFVRRGLAHREMVISPWPAVPRVQPRVQEALVAPAPAPLQPPARARALVPARPPQPARATPASSRRGIPGVPLGRILVDGTNILMSGWAAGRPIFENVTRVADELERLGYDPLVIFDASAQARLAEREQERLDAEQRSGRLLVAPGGLPADVYILRFAGRWGAPVVSNDRFVDHAAGHLAIGEPLAPGSLQHAWLLDAGRLVTFMVARGDVEFHARPLTLEAVGLWRRRRGA